MALEQTGYQLILQGFKEFQSGIDAVNKKTDSMTSKMSAFSKNLTSGFANASTQAFNLSKKIAAVGVGIGVAIGAGAAVAVSKASDLNETINKTKEIFEDSSKGILDWSQNSYKALGQSQQAALDAAADMATFGKSAGLTGLDLNDFSTKLVGLTSDLASFFNTDPSEAATAVSAALRGEYEPIRKYGVLLNEDAVRQSALALGIVKTTKDALTPQQRVLAVNALLWQQTTDAQGDFERTSSGLANTQRIISATFQDFLAKVGTPLLPLVEKIASAFANWAVDIMPKVVEWVNKVIEPINRMVNIFTHASSPIEGLRWVLADTFGRETMNNVMNIIKVIQDFANQAIAFVNDFVLPFVREHAESLKAALIAIAAAFGALSIIGGVIALVGALANPLTLIIAAVGLLAYAWSEDWGGIQEKTKAVIAFLKTLPERVEEMRAGIVEKIENLKNGLSERWDSIKTTVSTTWETIKTTISTKWEEIKSNVDQKIEDVKSAISTAWDDIKTTAETKWNNLLDTIRTLVGNLVSIIVDTDWKQAAHDVILGLINGINSYKDELIGKFKSLAIEALNKFKDALGIKHSPSEITKVYGVDVAAGFVEGMRKSMKYVVSASRLMANSINVAVAPVASRPLSIATSPALVSSGASIANNAQIGPITVMNGMDESQMIALIRREITRMFTE